jgi:Putative beta-barrel porin-2, OmpL-like. bbp2
MESNEIKLLILQNMKKIFLLLLIPYINYSQTTSINPITISAYIEPYFSYNTSEILKKSNQQFSYIYNHNANRQINVNLAIAKLNYATDNTRANIALMTGTYAIANLANEPSAVKNILEANAGVKLSKKKNIWLDAGVMPSHIGYETAIGKDNLTLTRSLMAENSPYFETGAKVSYTSTNEKLYVGALVLNGWQTIIPTANPGVHIGGQITYNATPKLKLNYSNFYGRTDANSSRMYHDLFAEYSMNNTKIVCVFDYGIDRMTNYNKNWFTYSAMVHQKLNAKNSVTARLEYFNDNDLIFTTSSTYFAKNPLSVSLNYDYAINKNALLRIEPKYVFTSTANLQTMSNILSYAVLSSSLCINF